MASLHQRKKVQPRAHPLSLPGEQMTGLTDTIPPPIPHSRSRGTLLSNKKAPEGLF